MKDKEAIWIKNYKPSIETYSKWELFQHVGLKIPSSTQKLHMNVCGERKK